jgi:hypothetical protein
MNNFRFALLVYSKCTPPTYTDVALLSLLFSVIIPFTSLISSSWLLVIPTQVFRKSSNVTCSTKLPGLEVHTQQSRETCIFIHVEHNHQFHAAVSWFKYNWKIKYEVVGLICRKSERNIKDWAGRGQCNIRCGVDTTNGYILVLHKKTNSFRCNINSSIKYLPLSK